jgi:hypothetical protein
MRIEITTLAQNYFQVNQRQSTHLPKPLADLLIYSNQKSDRLRSCRVDVILPAQPLRPSSVPGTWQRENRSEARMGHVVFSACNTNSKLSQSYPA